MKNINNNPNQDLIKRIEAFNQGRNAELLRLKYKVMRHDAFSFYRGSCHLFYEDWPTTTALNEAPSVWCCGDLHLENFGAYKGDNRLVYFDLNDFDEAALAPATWDLTRFITSLLVGGPQNGATKSESLALCQRALDTYTTTLTLGHARTVERETAVGLVKELLTSLQTRDRRTFLNGRTTLGKTGQRMLRIDGKKILPVSEAERTKILNFMQDWARSQPDPAFFKVLDLAHRIAGTGSLGIERYILLVEGYGSPDRNYLLDLKAQAGSSLKPFLTIPQPEWNNEAERVIKIQERVQGTPPALTRSFKIDGQAFSLSELQPTQDRVNLAGWNGRVRKLEKLVDTMAQLIAWDQLRSGGRQGSAKADDLIHFSTLPEWPGLLLDYARRYAEQVEADYHTFKTAYDNGLVKVDSAEAKVPTKTQTAVKDRKTQRSTGHKDKDKDKDNDKDKDKDKKSTIKKGSRKPVKAAVATA